MFIWCGNYVCSIRVIYSKWDEVTLTLIEEKGSKVHREVEVLGSLLSVLKFSVSSRSTFSWLDNRVLGSLFLEHSQYKSVTL